MIEHPILFSADMVKAILDGRKTQTRRVIKWDDAPDMFWTEFDHIDCVGNAVYRDGTIVRCPYGKSGDYLWVKETWLKCLDCGSVNYAATTQGSCQLYDSRNGQTLNNQPTDTIPQCRPF